MEQKSDTLEDRKLLFSVIAIEAGAKKLGVTPGEMARRLDAQGLIESRLMKHYEMLQLAEVLDISPARALCLFYSTDTCRMMHDEAYGIHYQSDTYLVNDVLQELRAQ